MHTSAKTPLLRRSGAVGLALAMGVSTALFMPNSAAIAEEVTIPADSSMSELGARFTLGVLPDTQFYSRYSTEETGNQYQATYGSEPFDAQTQWLVDNEDQYGIEMTMHLGDVVDQYNRPEQWDVANAAMQKLEDAGHPYSVIAGNHDVGAGASDSDPVAYDTYLQHFSPERAAVNSTFVSRDDTGAHEYHIFEVDGQEFLVMNLSWQATDASLAWASDVLDAHPNLPTIVNSHQLINVDADGTTPISTEFGERVWEQVISNHDQVFLTFNGHHHGATQWERTNDFGNPVHQVLMDYQMAYMGGNGYMGLVEFDLTHDKIHQTSFSPWVLDKATDTLVADDQALLTGAGQSFTIDFDFDARFPDLTVGAADDASATSALRDYLVANFDAPAQAEQVLPADANDYPVVENTVAHWTMPTDKAEGEIAPVGSVITDIAGGNDFTRAPLNEGAVTHAQESDVTWSTDHHPLSANAGSVCFDNASRVNNVASYFLTDENASVNSETFSTGFTLEAFVKIDTEYSTTDNAWMQWLTRDGLRGNVEGYTNTEGDEPPFAWAFSNLSEVQFSFVDSQNPPVESSNWSGEIVNLGEWLHLAAVNDPATGMTTLYIDGVPVLRNAPGTVGIGHDAAAQWVLGAGSYAGDRQSGYLGCLGEVRMVTEPLDADQWLTARADVTETPAPGTDADADAGADVTGDANGEDTAAGTDNAAGDATGTDASNGADGSDDAKADSKTEAGDDTGLAQTGADLAWPIFGIIALIIGAGVLLKLRAARAIR